MGHALHPARYARPVAVCAFMLLAALLASPGTNVSAAARVRGPYQLAPGVKLWRIRYPAPYQVRVLRIDPTLATMDVYPAAEVFGSLTRISDQALANGAIAAVNGDFGTFKDRPTHPSLIDAVLRTSGLARGEAFSVSSNGRRAWARTPSGSISATRGGSTFKVWRLNSGAARRKEIVAFTKVGGTLEHPASDMCAARLVPATGYRWSNAMHSGIARTYTVDLQPEPCRFRRTGFGAGAGMDTVILQARRACNCANRIVAMSVGDTVVLTWKTTGRPGTTDQVGGQPQLLRAGQNVAPGPNTSGSYFYDRNPRTGVGITQGCSDRDVNTTCYVYLITVDGRRPGWSRGMTLTRFAQEFLNQNPPAYYAFNLDGGGASEMWVSQRSPRYCETRPLAGGCTVNRPSDGHERAAITTIQVLPGPDPGEPDLTGGSAPATASASVAGPAIDPAAWAQLVSMDPGSTGGLFDALSRGGLGPAPKGPIFRRTLQSYRRALSAGVLRHP
jgi:Phosphodiester glycosidase